MTSHQSGADLDRDVTILVKAYEREESLSRLVASIRRFYPRIPILVVDDSAAPLDPVPAGVTRYVHEAHDSLGLAGGRNLGLRLVDTEYVVVCDDDMVFGDKTDLRRMLDVLRTTRFDIVSCQWLDHDPWRDIPLGRSRLAGSAEIIGDDLVRGLGRSRGRVDGLPVYDVLPNFFIARVGRLGPDPWDKRLNFMEHVEFFIAMKERGLLSTCLQDVVVEHHPRRPRHYNAVRTNSAPYLDVWRKDRGFRQKVFVGRWYTRRDRMRYYYPSLAAYAARRALRRVGPNRTSLSSGDATS